MGWEFGTSTLLDREATRVDEMAHHSSDTPRGGNTRSLPWKWIYRGGRTAAQLQVRGHRARDRISPHRSRADLCGTSAEGAVMFDVVFPIICFVSGILFGIWIGNHGR